MTKKYFCAITECRNSSEKTAGADVIFQKFPTKEKTRRRWIRTIQATFTTFSAEGLISPRLCSEHFEEGNFISSKSGKKIFKLDAVPTIFINNVQKKLQQQQPAQQEIVVRPRHQSRRAASKEALKQMQILLEDEDDAVEIPDDEDYVFKAEEEEEVAPVPVVISPPKKKYKLTHRKSSDGNDREVLVLKTITPLPDVTNEDSENNLELECWVEELEPCQKERNNKLEEEKKEIQSKLDELINVCKGEVVFKGDLTTVIEVSEHVQKTIQAVQASHNKPPVVLNNIVANPQPGYQLVMDPRLGLIVGTVPPATPSTPKPAKIQVATNLQASITPTGPGTPIRGRVLRGKKPTSIVQSTSQPPTPVTTRSLLNTKQPNKRTAPQPSPTAPPATRSRGNEPAVSQITPASQPVTRSREATIQQLASPSQPATRSRDQTAAVATPPVTRSRPGAVITNARPTESNVEGGLTTGTNLKPKAIVDLTSDDGRPLPDSREVSFNKLQGKTFPSLVVVARPHLRVTDVNSDRAKLDSKVKAVLMYAPTKFTEWLIQQGLVKSEQKCSMHSGTQLKLGMYNDVSKFPYSGGYVWISECCPQRFVSVFSGSIFEGSPHPPLVILKILYHWSCQTNIHNVTQWVKVDNLYLKGMYTWLRAICSVALQTHIRQLGGPQTKVEVGVISLGTTSQDGNSRQVKVEVLGVLETSTKLIRLRAIEPLADGDRNYKKRFSKILEPLNQWVHSGSIIITDLTVDKATLHQMGFSTVIQTTSVDATNSNRTIMEYLRRIVPRMFQNTLSLLSRQIIQQFLDELVWREWFGTTSMLAFDNLVSHIAEQTRHESPQSLIVRLNRVALNPFKNWGIPPTSNTVIPPAIPSATPKNTEVVTKKRKRKELEPQPKAAPPVQPEVNRPPKSTSPDVPEQMVPLENYYYGTIDNYPPKTNVTLNLKCPFCKEVYNNNIVLMNHLFKHAHNVSKDGQMCKYCLTSVPTANDLLKHIATSHPSETKHDNGFVCLICETQYMNPFVLGKHMSKEHCPSELPYQCGTCGYRCSNHKQAIDHFYKQHDNGPTIQCPFCLKSTTVFSSSRNIAQNMHYFIQHLQKHQRKQYARRCGKCNLWFVQKDVLKEHQTKMHASQRGKTGLIPWVAPTRNGVMVPKSKMDKYPCDAEGINFTTLFYNVSKGLKCKECNGAMDSSKHFPSFESCQNPNCQYSTCCSSAMQEHNAKCIKNSQRVVPVEKLPCNMFCICGYSSRDGNQLANHLAVCEKKSAYPSLSDAKSASVTHSMLDVLGLVRKPDETDKKPSARSRTLRRTVAKTESEAVSLIDEESSNVAKAKQEKAKNDALGTKKVPKVECKDIQLTDKENTIGELKTIPKSEIKTDPKLESTEDNADENNKESEIVNNTPTDLPPQQAATDSSEKPADDASEKVADDTNEKAADDASEKEVDNANEEVVDDASEKEVDNASGEKIAEDAIEIPADGATETTADDATVKATESAEEESVQESNDNHSKEMETATEPVNDDENVKDKTETSEKEENAEEISNTNNLSSPASKSDELAETSNIEGEQSLDKPKQDENSIEENEENGETESESENEEKPETENVEKIDEVVDNENDDSEIAETESQNTDTPSEDRLESDEVSDQSKNVMEEGDLETKSNETETPTQLDAPMSPEDRESTSNIASEKPESDIFEDVSEKDDNISQVSDDRSNDESGGNHNMSPNSNNTELKDSESSEVLHSVLSPGSSTTERKDSETPEALPSGLSPCNNETKDSTTPEGMQTALNEVKESNLEGEENSNAQNITEPMDYEDISSTGIDTLTAMETE